MEESKVKEFIEKLKEPLGGAFHCYACRSVVAYKIFEDFLIVLMEKNSYCDNNESNYKEIPASEKYIIVFNKDLIKIGESKSYEARDDEYYYYQQYNDLQEILRIQKENNYLYIFVKKSDTKVEKIVIKLS